MEVRKGVSRGGSKSGAAVSGRGLQQQVASDLLQPAKEVGSRSASVPTRGLAGRFTRSGSRKVEVDPIPTKLKEAVVEQDLAVGVLEEEDADSGDDEGSFEEGDEVGGHESVGCDLVSSSSHSDFDVEKDEAVVEKSGLSKQVGADQLFDPMPQSGPAVLGEKLRGDLRKPSLPAVGLGHGDPLRSSVPPMGGDQRAPWVSLFRDNRNLDMGMLLEEKEVDGDLVSLEADDVDVVEEAWGFCLVGLFAGKFPGWAAVSKLKDGWRVNCTQWRHRSGWLVFKFQSDEDRLKVLNGGPYFAYGSNLMLKILPSCFRFEGTDISSVPIWIQLPGLPLDCWNARALSKIVSKVGKPITTDKMTRTKERLSFARVLVEVDVSSEVVSDVEIRLPTGDVYHQLVISEFTPKFCRSCKSFGHVESSCGKASEGGQHRPYVARKIGPLDGGRKDVPIASTSSGGPAAAAVVGARVGGGVASKSVGGQAAATVEGARAGAGVGRAELGTTNAVVGASVRPAVAWMTPGSVQPDSRPTTAVGVGASVGQGKGVGATTSKGKEVMESGHIPMAGDSRQGPVRSDIQIVSSALGESTVGRKGKKKKKKSGKGDVLHDQQLSEGEDPLLMSYPYDGLEDFLEGGNTGGKKGGRKK